MALIELLPRQTIATEYMGDKVRVGFPIIAGVRNIVIHIGADVAKRLGITNGTRVSIWADEFYPYIYDIKVNPRGWKVVDISKKKQSNVPLYKIQRVYKFELPETFKEDTGMKFVTWNFYEGRVRLLLPGAKPEDAILHP